MSNSKAITLSVTTLANFACRNGDLMPAGVVGPTAREGMLAHKRVQKQAIEAAARSENESVADLFKTTPVASNVASNEAVGAEITLSTTCSIGAMSVKLSGRVDLIDFRCLKISEIKTSLVPVQQIPESQLDLQWAQLYLYGYLFLESSAIDEQEIDELALELIHVNLRANQEEYEQRLRSRQQLMDYAMNALGLYVDWIVDVERWQNKLCASAATLEFPYTEFRDGQRDMAAAVYRTARDASSLMVEAPTGVGKTISGLFPAVKAMGEGGIKQVVYLTAKVAGRLSAMQSIAHLGQAGLELTALQIRAKQSSCFCSNGRCERDDVARCPMTLGFFDRLPAARKELLECGVIESEQLDTVAWNHQLCPFELTLQLLPWVQVVVADYNYVFDPLVKLPHFSESRKDSLLLIDEAHNLLDRSRSMYSAKLSSEHCRLVARENRRAHPLLASALSDISRQMLSVSTLQEGDEQITEATSTALSNATRLAVENMVSLFGLAPALSETTMDLFRELCRYIAIDELFGEQHRCIYRLEKKSPKAEVSITLFCLDASKSLRKQYGLFKASVLFSATLRPCTFYRDTLGLPEATAQLLLPSPFRSERTCHAIVDWIDIRYRQREASLPALLELIKSTTEQRQGNYLVFFPSYAYLERVHSAFIERYPEVETWSQSSTQTREEHLQQLEHLEITAHRIGFAILGGVFGEGIDYVGDLLIGVIIVGTGLPGLDLETQLVSEHYRASNQNGYDFAYRYPGFTRVLQTAGRLIRHELDKGIVILIDDRFKDHFYGHLYPDNWDIRLPENQLRLTEEITNFWATLPD
ncbi:MAG: ATP-dependent DNA helicase [Granulosicoccus sp.]